MWVSTRRELPILSSPRFVIHLIQDLDLFSSFVQYMFQTFCDFMVINWHCWCQFVQEDNELRLVPGDELRLRYPADGTHSGWQSVGHVVCHAVDILELGLTFVHIIGQLYLCSNEAYWLILRFSTGLDYDFLLCADQTYGSRRGGS